MIFWKKDVHGTTVFGIMFNINDTMYCIVRDINAKSEKPALSKTSSILPDGYIEIDAREYYDLLKDYAEEMLSKI